MCRTGSCVQAGDGGVFGLHASIQVIAQLTVCPMHMHLLQVMACMTLALCDLAAGPMKRTIVAVMAVGQAQGAMCRARQRWGPPCGLAATTADTTGFLASHWGTQQTSMGWKGAGQVGGILGWGRAWTDWPQLLDHLAWWWC